MHPNSAFHWKDRNAMHVFVQELGFGQLFVATPDGPRVTHLPFIWHDDELIRFHIARGNATTRHLDGMIGLLVVNGPDAYISPDWYGLDNQVPTWNYIAVELEGKLRKLDEDELVEQVNHLSNEQEKRLEPKPMWTSAKMTEGYFDKMLAAIVGFEMRITKWRGTLKLGQNKNEAARDSVAHQLETQGRISVAHWMRNTPPRECK